MADTHRKNLLRDLASAARREQETREMSPGRALRLGLARAAAQLYDLPLQVTGVETSVLGLDAVTGACGAEMLLALLDGPEGARGAVGLSRTLVAALIEVQVMGVVSTLEVRDRVLTPTDAAMVAPWLDAALERVDHALAEAPEREARKDAGWLIGYRFGAMAEEPRALALALDATRFHLLRLTVDVALGRRIGEVMLLLPAAPLAEAPRPSGGGCPAGESFLQVPAELRVIAGRLSLPLSRAGALQPGDVLPLDGLSMAAAELRSVDGSLAGTARLGRMGDHWAVRFGAAEAPPNAPPPQIAAVPGGGAGAPAPARQAQTGQAQMGQGRAGQADLGQAELRQARLGQGTATPADGGAAQARQDTSRKAAQPPQTQGGQVAGGGQVTGPGDLPDLPPLDFDDPPGAESGVLPLGTGEDLGEDLGNAGFE